MTDSDKTAADRQAVVKAADDAARAAAAVRAATEEAAAHEKTAEELAAADRAAAEKASTEGATAEGTARKAGANTSITETLDATVGEDSAAPALQELEESPWNPERARDTTRSNIAYWLLALLTLVVGLSFASVMWISDGKVTFDNLKSLLELLLGPIVALVSAATGFYFGSQQANNSKKT